MVQRRRDALVFGACLVLAAFGVSAMLLCGVVFWRLFLAP